MKVFLLLLSLIFSVAICAPCDIYKSGGTPCVCAHSTVRALYSAYTGNLYQVTRDSDKRTADIGIIIRNTLLALERVWEVVVGSDLGGGSELAVR